MNKTLLTLLLGIGIGILVAPGKGSETWKNLLVGIDDYKDKLSDEVDDLAHAGKGELNKGKLKVQKEMNDFDGGITYS